MRADEVVRRYARKRKKLDLSLRLEDTVVLIEGGPDALKMLGELLIAVAQDKYHISMAPDGAGSVYFDPKSELGLYIHSNEHCDLSNRPTPPARSRSFRTKGPTPRKKDIASKR